MEKMKPDVGHDHGDDLSPARNERLLQNSNFLEEDEKYSAITSTDYRIKQGNEIITSNIAMDKIKDIMEQLEKDVLEKVSYQIKNTVTEVLQQFEEVQYVNSKNDLINESAKYNNRQKSSKGGKLPEKQFLVRNSLLTDLFEIKHIRTIYHIFVVILIIFFINTAIYDIVDTGSTNFGISIIMAAFGKFDKAICIWLGMMATTFGIHGAFSIWANQRIQLSPKSIQLKMWDYCWLITLIVYQILFIVFPVKLLLAVDLPPASSMAILMEQVRILMKTYAFIRSSAPRVLNYKQHAEKSLTSIYPVFEKYLYFLFCPTLVYRDDYPRTKVIRWRVVLMNYMEVVLIIFYAAFIFERSLIPVFKEFGKRPFEPRTLVLSIFGTMMPGTLVFLCGFYCLLHAWMNASSELLRFADRMFYKDWWNSTSFDAYYRTWNVVVHDWLYTYLYKDICELVAPQNKTIPAFAVFSVSAIFHEYILAFTFRFFYPALLFTFGGFGFFLVCVTRKTQQASGNIFMWLTLCTGPGTMLSLYFMEYFARVHCLPHEDEFLDLFIPRSWNCQRIPDSL